MKIKKYLPNILCLFLFLAYSIQAQGQKTIQHKTGAYYTGYMDNGYGKSMQKTHTYRTTVYANTNTVTLNIPPQRGGAVLLRLISGGITTLQTDCLPMLLPE